MKRADDTTQPIMLAVDNDDIDARHLTGQAPAASELTCGHDLISSEPQPRGHVHPAPR
jgi:hypothetical protein